MERPGRAICRSRQGRPSGSVVADTTDLYWYCLAGAAGFLLLGVLFVNDRGALALHLGTAAATRALLAAVF